MAPEHSDHDWFHIARARVRAQDWDPQMPVASALIRRRLLCTAMVGLGVLLLAICARAFVSEDTALERERGSSRQATTTLPPTAIALPRAQVTELAVTAADGGAGLGHKVIVSGGASHPRRDEQLWVVVKPGDGNYEPIETIRNKRDGSWRMELSLGLESSEEIGNSFDILIWRCRGEACRAIEEYVNSAEARGYPGLDTLPPEIVPVASTVVTRTR